MNKGTETIIYDGCEFICDWSTTPGTFDCEIYLDGVNVTDVISQDSHDYITTMVWNEINGFEVEPDGWEGQIEE
jgi:hypothetical protein